MPLKNIAMHNIARFCLPPKTALSPQTSIRLLPQANPDCIWKLRLPCHPTLLLPSYSAQTSYLLPAYRPVLHTQISLFYVPSMPYIYNLPGCTDIEISGIKFHSHSILSFMFLFTQGFTLLFTSFWANRFLPYACSTSLFSDTHIIILHKLYTYCTDDGNQFLT
mgnify:CR=1 FL=1